jgi:hypothetical protein
MEAITPPPKSRIETTTDRNGFAVITLPLARPSFARFAVSLFLLCWLGGWAFGWVAAFRQIVNGPKGPAPFLMFWLTAWTVGGCFAVWYLWRLLRPSVPETLTFATPNLLYDSGVQPFPIFFGYGRGQSDYWKKMFEKRKRIEFSLQEIRTLTLRDTSEGNRLTMDHANDRIDIGRGLTEVEREWLFRLLKTEYGI